MAMIGVGARIAQRAGADARAAARVCNNIVARSSADIALLVEALKDKGLVEEDHGPSTCSNPECGTIVEPGSPCPRCGKVAGSLIGEAAMLPSDESFWSDEDPVHAPETEFYSDIAEPIELPDYLMEALLEVQWSVDDAHEGALVLADIWPEFAPATEGEYREKVGGLGHVLKDRLLEHTTSQPILRRFRTFYDHESSNERAVQSEIRISRLANDDGWNVEVTDPLQDIVAGARDGRLRIGSFTYSKEQTLKLIRNRAARLPRLANALLYYREDFFNADSSDDASVALDKRALAQKDVAEAAEIPRATLCGWCNPDAGVWVDTPHGVYHLRDFFGRGVRHFSDGDLRQATVLGLILDARRDFEERGEDRPKRKDVVNWLESKGYELKMAERTRSKYFQRAETMEKVRGLIKDHEMEKSELIESMREQHKIELDERQLSGYLDMIQIYEEHSSFAD